MSRPPRVCIDASVWLAGFGNPRGSSGMVVLLGAVGCLRVVTSQTTMVEVFRHLPRIKRATLAELVEVLRHCRPEVMDLAPGDLARWDAATPDPDDRHVIAAAVKGRADALVTLDRADLLTPATTAAVPVPVMTPAGFLRWLREGGKV